jgi:hypothetical protein
MCCVFFVLQNAGDRTPRKLLGSDVVVVALRANFPFADGALNDLAAAKIKIHGVRDFADEIPVGAAENCGRQLPVRFVEQTVEDLVRVLGWGFDAAHFDRLGCLALEERCAHVLKIRQLLAYARKKITFFENIFAPCFTLLEQRLPPNTAT